MHLIFGAPRFMSTREFRHLYLKAETRQPKTTAKLLAENNPEACIVEKSAAEHYVTRAEWKVPSAALHAQYGNADVGFLPQSFKSHTKEKLKRILCLLGGTGLKPRW